MLFPLALREAQPAAGLQYEVHLTAREVPVVPEAERPAADLVELAHLREDEGLPDCPEHGRGKERRLVEVEQEAEQAGVAEIDLGRLHQPFAEVRVPGLEKRDLPRGFENAHPFPDGLDGDPDVARDIAPVEHRRRARRQDADEPLEVAQAADPEDLAHIAFEVGRQVPREEVPCGQFGDPPEFGELAARHQGGKAARIGGNLGDRPDLVEGEVLEFEEPGTACQAVGDPLHQGEVLAAGEDEVAHVVAARIDGRFQVAEEAGRVLHLVHQHRRGMLAEEEVGIALCLIRDRGQVERHVVVLGKGGAQQGRLPACRAPVTTTAGSGERGGSAARCSVVGSAYRIL